MIRSGVTRLSMPQKLYKLKNNLKRMFVSKTWLNIKTSKEDKGKRACVILFMTSFWNDILYSLKALGVGMKILRLIDNERKIGNGAHI